MTIAKNEDMEYEEENKLLEEIRAGIKWQGLKCKQEERRVMLRKISTKMKEKKSTEEVARMEERERTQTKNSRHFRGFLCRQI